MSISQIDNPDSQLEPAFRELIRAICEEAKISEEEFIKRAQASNPDVDRVLAMRFFTIGTLCEMAGWKDILAGARRNKSMSRQQPDDSISFRPAESVRVPT